MTYEEYERQVNETKHEFDKIEQKYWKRLRQLAYDYAMSNNTVNIGDHITDHVGTIEVDKINAGLNQWSGTNNPICWYEGWVLTKQGHRRKDKKRYIIFQDDII